jgi:hypothetical protein
MFSTKHLGKQRLLVLVLFIAFLATSVFLWWGYLKPELLLEKSRLADIKSNIVSVNQETEAFRSQIAEIEKYKGLLSALEENGFINNQDRILASERLEAVRASSRLKNVSYTLSPAIYTDVFEKKGQIISSELKFTAQALTDKDVYDFIYILNKGIPGFITVESLSINRTVSDVDDAVLDSIRKKTDTGLVSASFTIKWYSFVQTPVDTSSTNAPVPAQINSNALSSTGGVQ